ncbi:MULTISPECIES: polymorphic toxin-type HINT domain-containing protein, partial [unclassified Isoptericola]|uniref:polymorphic toxin-type HINT domain-containing protein n=1 Tax=unclassified Isoptericola TaxID=2623355 RepID=UPI00365999AC
GPGDVTAIEDIRAGDKVYAHNLATGADELQLVMETFVRTTTTLYHLTIAGHVVTTTDEHPFMVRNMGWILARDLQPGDILVTPDTGDPDENGTGTVTLDRIDIEHRPEDDAVTVYNIHVETHHNYYVLAGDLPVLVHNAGGHGAASRVTVRQVKQALGRAGMSVRKYDIVHVPKIDDLGGLIYGRSPFTAGKVLTGPRGRPLIEITDIGLSPANGRTAMENAVATVQHEIFHHRAALASSGQHLGTEAAAEAYADAMLDLFRSRIG